MQPRPNVAQEPPRMPATPGQPAPAGPPPVLGAGPHPVQGAARPPAPGAGHPSVPGTGHPKVPAAGHHQVPAAGRPPAAGPVPPPARFPVPLPPGRASSEGPGGSLRAMENPISATFDLAESVNEKVPRIRKMVRYASAFIAFALFIDFLLMIALLVNPILFLICLAFFIIGLFSLYWMRQVGSFFEYFAARHVAIKMMRDGDPVIHVPRGKDSLDRLLNHLRRSSPAFENLLRSKPGALVAPAIMKGASGIEYSFDARVGVPPAWPGGLLGLGNPGYSLFIKVLPTIPEMRDIRAVENAVEDVVRAAAVPPGRVIILAENREGREPLLPSDVYDHLTSSRLALHSGRRTYVCNLQAITVDTDGTYDFVPMISTPPDALP